MYSQKVALLFPGQGSQYVGMGYNLFQSFTEAKEVFQEVDDILQQNLSKLIFTGELSELTQTSNAQPAIMAVSIAVWQTLQKQLNANQREKLTPSVIAGHSLGEYTALCVSKAINLQQTTLLLQSRGEAMQNAVPKGQGGMAALLGVNTEITQNIIASVQSHGMCQIANDNGAGQIVISGDIAAINTAVASAKSLGAQKAIKLQVSAPFHSSFMKPAAEKMKLALEEVNILPLSMPVISNYSASPYSNSLEIKKQLFAQISNKVRWRESIENMYENYGCRIFIEVGPGKVLSRLTKKIYDDVTVLTVHDPVDIEKISAFLDKNIC